jgi:hypothetical protein
MMLLRAWKKWSQRRGDTRLSCSLSSQGSILYIYNFHVETRDDRSQHNKDERGTIVNGMKDVSFLLVGSLERRHSLAFVFIQSRTDDLSIVELDFVILSLLVG